MSSYSPDKRISEFASNTRPLDTRDRIILLTVWAAWRDCKTVTVRDLERACSYNTTSAVVFKLRKLRALGWLSYEDMRTRTYHPGPRFAVVDHGRILEVIESMEAD